MKMRTLQILTLALLAVAARADTFEITLNPTELRIHGSVECGPGVQPCLTTKVGTLHLMTDGICIECSVFQGGATSEINGITFFGLGTPSLSTYLTLG